MEVRLNVGLYGVSVESESTVDSDVVESAEDDVAEFVKLGISSSAGVGASNFWDGLLVASGVNTGRCDFGVDSFSAWAGL